MTMVPQNPFRYRGYYWDTGSGFYYLNSRYYDPATGRFINADVYISTGKGILGHNMYAYCRNNPVMRYDSGGYVEQEIWDDDPTTPVDDYGPVYTGHAANQTSGGSVGSSGGNSYYPNYSNNNQQAVLSNDALRQFGEKGNSSGFRVVNGSHNDAMNFVRSQTNGLSEYAPGKFVGYNSNGVSFRIYAQPAKNYTSIRISGVTGLRGIKFLW